jgi:D-alanyl-D-alanine carboxypeptidase
MREGRTLAALVFLLFSTSMSADSVDDYVHATMREHSIPGVAVAVLRHGRLVKLKAYGLANIETGLPATTQTVFELASLTKPFTATAIMLLEKDQKLELDTPVSRYVKGLPNAWDAVTIRHLLTHTSGLPELFPEETQTPQVTDYSTERLFRSLAGIPLAPAGSRAEYSDPGYWALGLVVERISGQTFGEFLESRIFGPLGMKNTGMIDLRRIVKNRAAGYTAHSGRLANNRRVWQYELASHYGINSTIEDLVRWEEALVDGQVLSRGTLTRMWSPAHLNDGEPVKIFGDVGYGLGWLLYDFDGRPTTEHGGYTGTHMMRCLDDSMTVILLTNLDIDSGWKPHLVAREIARRAKN